MHNIYSAKAAKKWQEIKSGKNFIARCIRVLSKSVHVVLYQGPINPEKVGHDRSGFNSVTL